MSKSTSRSAPSGENSRFEAWGSAWAGTDLGSGGCQRRLDGVDPIEQEPGNPAAGCWPPRRGMREARGSPRRRSSRRSNGFAGTDAPEGFEDRDHALGPAQRVEGGGTPFGAERLEQDRALGLGQVEGPRCKTQGGDPLRCPEGSGGIEQGRGRSLPPPSGSSEVPHPRPRRRGTRSIRRRDRTARRPPARPPDNGPPSPPASARRQGPLRRGVPCVSAGMPSAFTGAPSPTSRTDRPSLARIRSISARTCVPKA